MQLAEVRLDQCVVTESGVLQEDSQTKALPFRR